RASSRHVLARATDQCDRSSSSLRSTGGDRGDVRPGARVPVPSSDSVGLDDGVRRTFGAYRVAERARRPPGPLTGRRPGIRHNGHDMATTVLIVDDHAAFRASARLLLEAEGFDVVGEAADGGSAIEKTTALAPDLLLLDVQLPDIDGFEVATRVLR